MWWRHALSTVLLVSFPVPSLELRGGAIGTRLTQSRVIMVAVTPTGWKSNRARTVQQLWESQLASMRAAMMQQPDDPKAAEEVASASAAAESVEDDSPAATAARSPAAAAAAAAARQVRPRIKVVGIGGAGANTACRIPLDVPEAVELLLLNTDAQALRKQETWLRESSSESFASVETIQMGPTLLGGQSTGGNASVGLKAALESSQPVQEALGGADLVFLTCGLGGGTGSGATPLVARLARAQARDAHGLHTRSSHSST